MVKVNAKSLEAVHTHTHTLCLLNRKKKLNIEYNRSNTVSIFDTS